MKCCRPVLVLIVAAALLPLPVHAEGAVQPVQLVAPDGSPVQWLEWVAADAPAAVLFWASWAPRSDTVLAGLADLATACRKRELKLIIIDVQESLADARAALADAGVGWLHDRHGALLKEYRVIRVPALLIVDVKGKVLAELAPTPAAVSGWRAP